MRALKKSFRVHLVIANGVKQSLNKVEIAAQDTLATTIGGSDK